MVIILSLSLNLYGICTINGFNFMKGKEKFSLPFFNSGHKNKKLKQFLRYNFLILYKWIIEGVFYNDKDFKI